ncbi:hypothetical protein M8J76_010900 [Diaphorina citri]|nr:hypothetical protein M8J76_010900 [Diaphorina citri]
MSVIHKEKKFKPYLKYLITHILGLEEDDEDFEQCLEFALSNVLYHHFMCVDKFKVNSCLNGLVEKFKYHGFINKSKHLKQCKEKFMNLAVVKNHPEYDIGWSILSLLSLLAENPTGCLSDSLIYEEVQLTDTSLSISTLQAQDDEIDWYSYLREGDERFELPSCDSPDEWTDDEEDHTVSKLSDSESADLVTVVSKHQDDTYKPPASAQGSDKQFFSKLIRRKMQSLEWLKSHRQHSWWNDDCLREIPQSKLRDANLAIQWEKFTRFEEKLNIISEYKLLREFLWCAFVLSPGAVIFRPYYSLCSVRPDTLAKFLSPGLETLRLYREMSSFRSHLTNTLCSHTLRVYACALADILRPLGARFVHTERIIRAGESKMTLLDLSVDLEAEFGDVRYIYFNIHARVTRAWRDTPHYVQAHNVIQVLFDQLREASNSSRVSMCTSLLVQCLAVSFETVDVLLSEGRLYDPTMDNEIKPRLSLTTSTPANDFLRSFYEETSCCANAFVLVDKLNKLVALESSIQNKGE